MYSTEKTESGTELKDGPASIVPPLGLGYFLLHLYDDL